MYLKSLELQGFKSFPDKTKLTFEEGTTVIVGPNGSGKSNIADAMRWVLGEISSKSMRGTKMEDIIFGGASSRRPMGYAEVSVTFDNTDPNMRLESPYDEVTVTRRYYRAGESEYFINRKAVRLRDIYELFMNTGVGRDGYSIIGQGKIAEMVSRKSEERRTVFEDASGIAKFRHKKTEAERKLAATEDNMTRVNDIFLEVESQVGPLEKEAEKAKRAIELHEIKKKVDVQLWLYDTEKLRADITATEENFARSSFDLKNTEEAIASLQAQDDRLYEAAQSGKQHSEELLTQIREQTNKNHDLDSQYRVAENNIAHTKELRAAAEGTVASVNRSIETETATCGSHLQKIEELSAQLTQVESAQREASEKQRKYGEKAADLEARIATALYDIRNLDAEAVDVKVRLSVLENANVTANDQNSSILAEMEEYQKISTQLREKCLLKQRGVDEYQESIDGLDAEIDSCMTSIDEKSEQVEKLEEQLSGMRLRRDSVNQRIDTFRAMEEHFEGYNNSVRFVMKQYAAGQITDARGMRCGTVYGPLSKIISVDEQYVTAIETALGTNLQNIVVEDEQVAKAAMYALKRAEAGRATFFPLTSMRGQSLTPELQQAKSFPGYVAMADQLTASEPKFREILSALLGRTVIFDDIDHATAMAKAMRYRVRVVTLDGQQINAGGSFTGGSVKQKSNILGRAAEIKKLEEERESLIASIARLEKTWKAYQDEMESLELQKTDLADRRHLISVMQNSEKTQLDQLQAKLEANNGLLEKLRADAEQLENQSRRHEEDLEELRTREKELLVQIAEITSFREQKDAERNDALEKKAEQESILTDLHIRLSELQKDIETENTLLSTARARMESAAAEVEVQRERIAVYGEQLRALEEAQRVNREAFALGEKTLTELNDRRATLERDNFEFDRKRNEINIKRRDKESQKDVIFREYTRLETRLAQLREEQDGLSSQLWDDYQLTRAAAIELNYPPLTSETRAEAAKKQIECRNKLRWIGHVDLDAVNKYHEVKARYDTMKAQIEDLAKARNELTGIIGRLEKEMTSAFSDAFNAINENFGRVFRELFGGGSAELSLSDPENVLESGIEIKAAPPGKIIKNLMQLSGGEQSFIGVALFFAILQVNPTPFCILDEIEAALDEVNVARLAEYIKRYVDGTQFIMITHRRGTMEAANRLYGVTMPEQGISKILSLDISNISKKEGEEWDGIFG
ncbi:MAG: chromosome segregation protein SMC [Clostridia bacterium]|nr:chromosome segregation protein SMC [Clostridia bacterium]